MHVIISSPSPVVSTRIGIACSAVDLSSEVEPSLQEFGSLLFRQPEAIGVYWSIGPASAAEACRRLRMGDVRNPLLALLDDGSVGNRAAMGRAIVLDAGTDDVQHWPLEDDELIARLFALARRKRIVDPTEFEIAGCVFIPGRGELNGPAGSVHLTGTECTLLAALLNRPGMMMTKAMCMLALYNGHDEPQSKIIDVFICKLRKKLAAATVGLNLIETLWGQGYRFVPEGAPPIILSSRSSN